MHSDSNWRRSFCALWIFATTSYFLSWSLRLALPLLLVQLSNSPLLLSGMAFAFTAPWLLFGLGAGVVVDRWNRRTVLQWVATIRMITLTLLLATALAEQITVFSLYATAVVLGTTETFAETATAALLPMVAPRERLDHMNTRLTGSQMVIELFAIPAGGLLASLGLLLTASVACVCAAVAWSALWGLHGNFRAVSLRQQHIVTDISEGLGAVWRQRTLWTIAIIGAVINGCWGAWLAVLPLHAVTPGPMRLTEFTYSLMLAGGSAGGVIGALITVPVQQRLGRRWALGLNIFGNIIMFAAPAVTYDPWFVGGAAILGGLGGPMWAITTTSLRQHLIPDALQGRVTAAYRFVGYTALALGPILGGAVAQGTGVPTVLLGVAILTAVTLVPFFHHVPEAKLALHLPHEPNQERRGSLP